MKILIAIDASPHSEKALDFVARMRWPAGSRVIVLSVLQPVINAVVSPFETAGVEAELLDQQRQTLEALVSGAERRLRETGMSTEGRVVAGDPREVLIQLARGERADLLVVGSHGHTGIAKWMLGSVSAHVVTHAPCSVLVVKVAQQSALHPERHLHERTS